MTLNLKVALVMFLSLLLWPSSQVMAQCCSCIGKVGAASQSEWFDPWPKGSEPVVNTHIDNEFNAHETWLVKFLLEDNILPAMMLMAEQLTATAMAQVGAIGMLFDAKQQLETQRSVQNLQAEIHRDYHPSVGLCEIGSGIKSLAATERLGDYNAVLLAQRSLDRHLGNANTSGHGGEQYDKENRLTQFALTYCDLADNNKNLGDICDQITNVSSPQGGISNFTGPTDLTRLNKDINFARTLGTPWTIEANYGDIELKPAEEDVIALQNNLFGHKVFTRIPGPFLADQRNTTGGFRDPQDVRDSYLDMRAVIAKRGVAENSYAQFATMKTEGTGASTEYLREMMKELGLEADTDLEKLLGKNPSYYAQMEVLTKKIYQNPDFFTNLYDKPANVSRKEAAITALELIQKFDMFKSNLRAEANLSLMLENAVISLQSEAENTLSEINQDATAEPATGLDDLGGDSATP